MPAAESMGRASVPAATVPLPPTPPTQSVDSTQGERGGSSPRWVVEAIELGKTYGARTPNPVHALRGVLRRVGGQVGQLAAVDGAANAQGAAGVSRRGDAE